MTIKGAVKKYKLGTITGFIFGILLLPLATMGLVSSFAVIILPFALPGLIPTGIFIGIFGNAKILPPLAYTLIWVGIGTLINGFFYSYIGFLIQRKLRKKKKNEKIVLYIPLAIIGLVALSILLESLIKGGLTP